MFIKLVSILPPAAALAWGVSFASVCGAQSVTFATQPSELAGLALAGEPGSAQVGVWSKGQSAVASAPFTGSSLTGQRLYEIGSISKVFTGLLLAQAVEAGDLKLDDNLGQLLAGKAALPDPVAAITLRQLITHSSCLPGMPADFASSGDLDKAAAEYAAYDRPHLWAALGKLALAAPPPCLALYSNFGMAVVGELLSERYGQPWQELVKSKITEPLGMKETAQALSEPLPPLAPAFNHLAPALAWDFKAFAGAGALRSTAADMLVFGRAVMAGAAGPLGPAAARLVSPLGRFGSSEIGYAVMLRGPAERRAYFHDGLTGGFRSAWLVSPATQEVAVLLTSNAHAQTPKVAALLEASLFSVEPAALLVAPPKLSDYPGQYRVDAQTTFIVALQDGVLYRRRVGGGFRPLAAHGPDLFIDREYGVRYVFKRSGGAVTGLEFSQGGPSLSAVRTSEPAPALAVLPLDQQQAYVGKFQLKRLVGRELNFDVVAEGGQLGVRSGNWQRQNVFPVPGQPDRFVYDGGKVSLQFERDASGAANTLVLFEGGAVLRMQRLSE